MAAPAFAVRRSADAASPRGVAIVTVQPIPFQGDDRALLDALRGGHPGAAAALYDRFAPALQRTLERTLGPDADVPDLLQEVFVTAFAEVGKLSDPEKLGSWLTSIAVFTARACIRRRARRRWLAGLAFAPVEAEPQAAPAADAAREALRECYDVLGALPADERIAFALRIIDGRPLQEAADAARTSLATFKRRLARAEARFVAEAERRPALVEWMDGGTRWTEGRKTRG